MKLYDLKNAPNPRRVKIFLAEKKISLPIEALDIETREHLTPGVLAKNPLGKLPVLELDDGTVLCESIAICRYFEEMVPEPPLFGRSTLERAQVEMWNRRMELNLLFCVAQVFRHLHPAMAQLEVPQVSAWGEANRPRVLEILQYLDEELGTRRYIAGDHYSVADITALVAVDFMKPARIQRPEGLKHLARWHEEASARPSAKA